MREIGTLRLPVGVLLEVARLSAQGVTPITVDALLAAAMPPSVDGTLRVAAGVP